MRKKLIANCPVTVQDVHNANRIFGPGLANLRGKMTRKQPEHIGVDYVEIPWNLVNMHKYVTLVADVIFVNGLPVFGYLVQRNKFGNNRVLTITNCEALSTHCRTSAECLCKIRVCCPNNDNGHGV